MFRDFKIKLGYAPTRRTLPFPDPKYAIENEKKIRKKTLEVLEKVGNVELITLDEINDEGLLRDLMEADTVAEMFKEKKVDAIFAPHANFGCEEAVARLAKKVGVPVLLWAPVDDSFPERVTDSQCGLFATSSALLHLNIPFDYIVNCRPDDSEFAEGLEQFIRVASVVKEFRNMRIAHVGSRPQAFLSVRYNENELCEKLGIEVVAVDTTELIYTFNTTLEKYGDEIDECIKGINKKMDTSKMDPEKLRRSAAAQLALSHIAKAHGCNAMASQCFELFQSFGDIWPCSAFGNLTEEFLPVACETDVLGAISSALLQAAARGDCSTFLTDLCVRHPENKNSELLWHCGVFPPSLAKDGKARVEDMCVNMYELKQGEITICRFGGINGEYLLFADEAKTGYGPETDSTYIWAEFEDWAAWEKKFIYGPYVHHVSVTYGKYAKVLHEACKYLNGVTADYVG